MFVFWFWCLFCVCFCWKLPSQLSCCLLISIFLILLLFVFCFCFYRSFQSILFISCFIQLCLFHFVVVVVVVDDCACCCCCLISFNYITNIVMNHDAIYLKRFIVYFLHSYDRLDVQFTLLCTAVLPDRTKVLEQRLLNGIEKMTSWRRNINWTHHSFTISL